MNEQEQQDLKTETAVVETVTEKQPVVNDDELKNTIREVVESLNAKTEIQKKHYEKMAEIIADRLNRNPEPSVKEVKEEPLPPAPDPEKVPDMIKKLAEIEGLELTEAQKRKLMAAGVDFVEDETVKPFAKVNRNISGTEQQGDVGNDSIFAGPDGRLGPQFIRENLEKIFNHSGE